MPSKKPSKGKKLPNRYSGITEFIAAYALSHKEFPLHYEDRLWQFFRLAAVLLSLQKGLIPQNGF